MKPSTALFASILSICLAASYVSGQIVFPDSTVQTTASGGSFVVQPGDAYHYSSEGEYLGSTTDYPNGAPISASVPAGHELVILQISNHESGADVDIYEVDQGGIADLLYITYPSKSSNYGYGWPAETIHFANGVFTIDEGNQLNAKYAYSGGYETSVSIPAISVFGYYRQK